MESVAMYFILCFLLILSAFFSASETALTAFSRSKLKEIEEKNPYKASLLRKWLKNPNTFLSAMLIGNNLVNLLSSSIATTIAIYLIGNTPEAIAVSTLSVTVILLIFGELTPKVVAKAYSTQFSLFVINIIFILSRILLPISLTLIFISKFISRMFGVKISEVHLLITEEEIKSVVSVGEEEGVIDTDEKKMIHSIFEFTDTTVKEIMIHRTAIFSLEATKTLEDSWDLISENGYSRIPVYENTIDNIIGILYQKDLFKILKDGNRNVTVREFIRDPYFVPETKPLKEMLEDFKKKQIHMAVVIDEYGGTSGIITIEDLIEEIVGDIRDEFDMEAEEDIIKVADNKFIVNALLDVEEVNSQLTLSLPVSDDYDSLGGYVYAALGRIPLEKDTIFFNEHVEIKILQVKNRRVVKVLIILK